MRSNRSRAPPEFFTDLLGQGDDWTFVIKFHAIIEAAFTQTLTRRLGVPEFESIFADLELSNASTGKIAFGKAAGLIDDLERRYVRALSELRNTLVHDVRKVGFRFDEYLQVATQRKSFVKSFAPFIADQIDVPKTGKPVPATQFVIHNPRFTIWANGVGLMQRLYIHSKCVLSAGLAN